MKKLLSFALFLVVGFYILHNGNEFFIEYENNVPSSIENNDGIEVLVEGKRMPSAGKNFETYSYALSTIGRTHVHSQLRPVLLDAYDELDKVMPTTRWIFGEIGWRNGGKFWPHRTHRNGLNVDFIVPVVDKNTGDSRMLPLNPINAYGYRTRFDENGESGNHKIDFDAMIQHLMALSRSSEKRGLKIKRVIFDPPLYGLLAKRPSFQKISNLEFMKTKAWFPHDSHYHIEFELL